jgi:hypothetical protein
MTDAADPDLILNDERGRLELRGRVVLSTPGAGPSLTFDPIAGELVVANGEDRLFELDAETGDLHVSGDLTVDGSVDGA